MVCIHLPDLSVDVVVVNYGGSSIRVEAISGFVGKHCNVRCEGASAAVISWLLSQCTVGAEGEAVDQQAVSTMDECP